MMRILLRNYSRVNFKDLVGKTALNYAVESENIQLIKGLLCMKADPESKNNQAKTILEIYESKITRETNLEIGSFLKLAIT